MLSVPLDMGKSHCSLELFFCQMLEYAAISSLFSFFFFNCPLDIVHECFSENHIQVKVHWAEMGCIFAFTGPDSVPLFMTSSTVMAGVTTSTLQSLKKCHITVSFVILLFFGGEL